MKCLGTTPVCSRRIYDFEDGTTQGHVLRTDIVGIGQSAVKNSTTRAHPPGTHSLALPLFAAGGTIDIDISICGGADIPLPVAPRSISAWFFLDGPLVTTGTQNNFVAVGMWACNADFCTHAATLVSSPVPVGAWTQIVAPVPADLAAQYPNTLGYAFTGFLTPAGAGTTLYVDDIVWQ